MGISLNKYSQQRDIGLKIAKMLSELIRDNRNIVDSIKKTQIDTFINLLKQTEVLIAISLSCFAFRFVLAYQLLVDMLLFCTCNSKNFR